MDFDKVLFYEERFSRKFKKVHDEIDYLEAKIHKKKGVLFFKSHVYSVEELLKSEHHAKIYSITGKIGDDVTNWYKAGNMSSEEVKAYRDERDDVDERLHEVNLEIQNREPTWWEEIKEPFTEFYYVVMRNLPDLIPTLLGKLLDRIGLPSPLRKILHLPQL